MQSGLSVSLDPSGGNQLNVRALLRAKGVRTGHSDVEEDAIAAVEGGEEEEEGPRATRRGNDDYDYNDDFIDDDELVEEDDEERERFLYMHTPRKSHTHRDDDVFTDDALGTADPYNAPPTVQPVDNAFYVNRGEIRSRPKFNSVQKRLKPKTVESALASNNEQAQAQKNQASVKLPSADADARVLEKPTGRPTANAKTGESIDVSAENEPDKATPGVVKRPPKQQVLTVQGRLSIKANPKSTDGAGKRDVIQNTGMPSDGTSGVGVGSEAGTKKRRVEESGSGARNAKRLHVNIEKEISALQALCTELFGEKKPDLNDLEVQSRLYTLFKEAMAHNAARLHSDVAKDNRRVALSDELWGVLSKFLRTTRGRLERLGHALHWSEAEKVAQTRVENAEKDVVESIRAAVKKDNEVTNSNNNNIAGRVEWTPELDVKMFAWYRARCDLQEAKNQLGARPKSAKKAMVAWVQALHRTQLSNLNIMDQEIIDSFRRVEDERNAMERKRKEQEREARRRKRDENALPKKISDALPPGLRRLASLKARPDHRRVPSTGTQEAATAATAASAASAATAAAAAAAATAVAAASTTGSHNSGSNDVGGHTAKNANREGFEVIEID